MNKWLLVVVVLLCLCCGGGLFGGMAELTRGAANLKSAAPWVDEHLPAVAQNWDPNTFRKDAAPMFLAAQTSSNMERMFDAIRKKLGKPKKLQPAKFLGFDSKASVSSGKQTVVRVTVDGEFEHDQATLEIAVVRVNSKDWQWASLFVRAKSGQ